MPQLKSDLSISIRAGDKSFTLADLMHNLNYAYLMKGENDV